MFCYDNININAGPSHDAGFVSQPSGDNIRTDKEANVEEETLELSIDNGFLIEIISEPERDTNNFRMVDGGTEVTEEDLINDSFVIMEPISCNVDESLLRESTLQIEFSSIVPPPAQNKNGQNKKSRKKREKQHSEIMTTPEYKAILVGKRNRREMRELKKRSPKTENVTKKRGRPKKNEVKNSIVTATISCVLKKSKPLSGKKFIKSAKSDLDTDKTKTRPKTNHRNETVVQDPSRGMGREAVPERHSGMVDFESFYSTHITEEQVTEDLEDEVPF